MKTNTALPRLRFPEFKNSSSWRKKKLIDVTDENAKWSFIGGPFGSNLKASDYTSDGIRVIQLQNIGNGEFSNDSEIYTSEEKADELLANNIYPHDIILSKMGDPVGRACLIPDTHDRYVMCSDGIRLVVDEQHYNKYFIYSFINSDTFRTAVERKSTGSTRKRIGLSHLKNLPLLIPSLAEQKKIADCLASLDTLLNAESQQLESLQTHKEGLLQQLFPAEGETVPKIRFDGFKGDWGLFYLKDVSINLDSRRIPITAKNREKGKIPYYGASGIIDYVRDYIFDDNLLCISEDGANLIDRVYPIAFSVQGKSWINNHAHVLKFESLETQLLVESYLNSISLETYLTGVAQPKLNQAKLNSILIPLPDITEQQKIADCLSSIDTLIEAQASKIETLKQHKQGLMQQLFPL